MWFKNLRVFRLHPEWNLNTEQVLQALDKQRFHSLGSQDQHTIGWVEPAAEYGLALSIEHQLLLCAQTEKKLLPASVINQAARERAVEIENEQGYRPGRKQMQEIKEDVTAILLPRAFSVQRRTHVWIDPINRWLVIDAAAQSTADEVLTLLGETFNPFPALPIQTEKAPNTQMKPSAKSFAMCDMSSTKSSFKSKLHKACIAVVWDLAGRTVSSLFFMKTSSCAASLPWICLLMSNQKQNTHPKRSSAPLFCS